MSSPECALGTPLTTLIAYWLGELDAAAESALEEHLFSCETCHAQLRQLVELGRDIRHSVRAGHLHAVLTPDFVRRLQDSGLRLREYHIQPGGAVFCTVAPEDDLVISHLHAPLAGIQRLDLVSRDETAGTSWRVEDIAFDPRSEEVTVAPDIAMLRGLSHSTHHMELVAIEGTQERMIARYTFNHSPYVDASAAK